MTQRVMRDSTNIADIPVAGTDIVAVYRNGRYAVTSAEVRARFPTQPAAWIDVTGGHPQDCEIIDVETGDATVLGAVAWTGQRHALHPGAYPPVIYCNRARLTPLFNAMNAAGYQIVRDFRLWIATLDGKTKTVADMTGVTAVQWKPASALSGPGHYDESAVYDDHWHAPILPPEPDRHGYLVPTEPLGVPFAVTGRLVTAADTGKPAWF